MSSVVLRIAAIGLFAAACAPSGPPAPPTVQNGVLVYSQNGARQTIQCDNRPIQLSGDRTALRLTGECQFVRLAGNHNDIEVEAAPGATIEITGEHNDLTWRQTRPGPHPVLLNRGQSNSFHTASG